MLHALPQILLEYAARGFITEGLVNPKYSVDVK